MNIPDLSFLVHLVDNQPWYKKAAKAVTGVVGAVIAIIWVAITSGVDIPDGVEKWVLVVIAALTALGVYQVPNAVTSAQLNQIEASVGKHQKPE